MFVDKDFFDADDDDNKLMVWFAVPLVLFYSYNPNLLLDECVSVHD